MSAPPAHVDVLVVGAGVSGLVAARTLRENGCESVCVVDARAAPGGRVMQVHGVAPWPLEAGPEFVHGARSALVKTLRERAGMRLREETWPNYVFWGDEGKLTPAEGDAGGLVEEVDRLMFDELPDQPIPQQDISVEGWMRSRGVSARAIELADVCYANDFGTGLASLGMTEAILEARTWDAGEEYLIKDRSFEHLVDHLSRDTHIALGWPVRSIHWSAAGGARVVGPNNQVITCKHVVCTVPLTQLRKGCIAFEPPLAACKLAAIQRVRMGGAIKVWAVVSERFWPEDAWDVVCTHRLFPEFWMCRYSIEGGGGAARPSAAQGLHCITAFVCGERAERLSRVGDSEKVQLLLRQVDEVFCSAEAPRPASAAFVRGAAVDWSKEAYIEGGYSAPSVGARAGDRAAIAAPVGGVLFFAGEHTHPCLNPCLQGAMETGDRAAAQVVLARRAGERSKL